MKEEQKKKKKKYDVGEILLYSGMAAFGLFSLFKAIKLWKKEGALIDKKFSEYKENVRTLQEQYERADQLAQELDGLMYNFERRVYGKR